VSDDLSGSVRSSGLSLPLLDAATFNATVGYSGSPHASSISCDARPTRRALWSI
jgi:hypothetical protein